VADEINVPFVQNAVRARLGLVCADSNSANEGEWMSCVGSVRWPSTNRRTAPSAASARSTAWLRTD